jgi:hypothetical protein
MVLLCRLSSDDASPMSPEPRACGWLRMAFYATGNDSQRITTGQRCNCPSRPVDGACGLMDDPLCFLMQAYLFSSKVNIPVSVASPGEYTREYNITR